MNLRMANKAVILFHVACATETFRKIVLNEIIETSIIFYLQDCRDMRDLSTIKKYIDEYNETLHIHSSIILPLLTLILIVLYF